MVHFVTLGPLRNRIISLEALTFLARLRDAVEVHRVEGGCGALIELVGGVLHKVSIEDSGTFEAS